MANTRLVPSLVAKSRSPLIGIWCDLNLAQESLRGSNESTTQSFLDKRWDSDGMLNTSSFSPTTVEAPVPDLVNS